MIRFLSYSNDLLFLYYLTTNLVYLILLVFSVIVTTAHNRRLRSLWLDPLRYSKLTTPISILVPAHNEEKSIVESVQSLLALDYPELEVIVVNDGSSDDTLLQLQQHFRLLPTDILHVSEIPTRAIKGVYMSMMDHRLLVLDKESSGRKADALNAALDAATGPLVCAIDADAILEKDSLLRIMAPILTDPTRVVASGGIVRVANGSVVENGAIKKVRFPRTFLEGLQVIEYLRAFLIGRQGWAYFNLLILISGAFGLFRLDIVRKIGGFRSSTVGEDLDLIVRMHRWLRERGEDYHIAFVPDPVCWTEVPSTWKSLARQRARWQNGLADVLWQNRDMLFSRRYGSIGLVALPYHLFFELVAPLLEVFGWITLLIAALMGVLASDYWLNFLLFGYLFGAMITIGSIVLEELTFHRYNDKRDLVRLLAYSFVEFFPYRQLNALWRIRGLWNSLTGRNAWTNMERVGFIRQPGPAA